MADKIIKNIHRKSLVSVVTFSLITSGIMTFVAVWGSKPLASVYWGIAFTLWSLGLLLAFFLFIDRGKTKSN